MKLRRRRSEDHHQSYTLLYYLLNFDVYLGSRLQISIFCKRQRVQSGPEFEQELIVACAVSPRTDGTPWRSPELRIEPHALCSKSAYDFEDADNDVYDVWHQLKQAEIQDWLMAQYTSLSARSSDMRA